MTLFLDGPPPPPRKAETTADTCHCYVYTIHGVEHPRGSKFAKCDFYVEPPPPAPEVRALDLVAHLHRQRAFSERTFGPGARTAGVCDHIRKELAEIESAPADVEEWIDVVLLALDGAWRSGATPEQIATALDAKQTKNERRKWPDWRTVEPGKAIEHDRTTDASLAAACGMEPNE